MRTNRTMIGLASVMAMTFAATSLAQGARITLHRNLVIPVRLDNDLSVRENRAGDRFLATVTDSRDLPRGTRFEGRVVRVEQRRDDRRPAYLDLEFTTIILPDGKRVGVRSVPVSLDRNYVARDSDGRWRATDKVIRKQDAVIGGTVGGLIIGALLKKPFEGAFIGALAGIVLAESQQNAQRGEVFLRRGTEMGALIERDVTFDYTGRAGYGSDDYRSDDYRRSEPYRGDDRYDRDRRDDRYDRDRRDDRYDNDPWDDRYRSGDWSYQRVPQIYLRNRQLRYGRDEQPYLLGNTFMVHLERTASQIDADVDARGNVIWVESQSGTLRLEQGSTEYRLNGRRGTLPRAVTNRRGIIYVPIEALQKIAPSLRAEILER